MRFTLVAIIVGLCVYASARFDGHVPKAADKQFLEKQKNILRLFKYVNQPSYYKDHVQTVESFNFEQFYDHYTKPEVAQHFHKLYKYGLLPKGEIFSVFYDEQLQEAIALFKLFYYAKDYETFYKTAVWARNHVNEGVYLYALSVAIVHREDTHGIVLPPIYEIYPYYFFSSEVIEKAQQYKQQYYGEQKSHGYTIDSNYSGYYLNLHPEQSLSYFTEDVGLNSFYYYHNLYYPFWLGGQDFDFHHERRGELYYYFHQQLLARYYLERLSNDFGEIPYLDWEVPLETGYYPSLQYPNGLEFPTRPNFAHLYEYFYNYGQKWNFKSKYGYSYTLVRDYERRIRDAIDSGVVFTKEGKYVNIFTEEGFNTLGNLIEGNADSPNSRFYGAIQVFARHLLGYSHQPLDKYKIAPSALEHFETTLRDPAFYQLYKKIILFFIKYQYQLPAYTENELYFPGVQVKNVEVDRLITYFDYFYSDLSNAVYVTPEEYQTDKFQVRVRQYRLNHKAFTYKIHVTSDNEQDAAVRVYLGPKYDEYGRYINITENRFNFVQLDHFKYKLKSGENVIERNSHENYFYQNDRTTYKELYKKVVAALEGNGEFVLDGKEAYYGVPRRFLLPKGTYAGTEYQIYVIVNKYVPFKGQDSVDASKYYYPKIGTGQQYADGYPLGFPLDRPIYSEHLFQSAPNSYFYTTKIYHRKVEDIQASSSQ